MNNSIRKTLLNKKEGSAQNLLLCICFIMIIVIILAVVKNNIELTTSKNAIKNSIKLGLQAADISEPRDDAVYIKTFEYTEDDIKAIYKRFKKITAENLHIDADYESSLYELNDIIGTAKDTDVNLMGEVKVKEFTFYNVQDDHVDVYVVKNGIISRSYSEIPEWRNVKIQATSITVDVGYSVQGFFGTTGELSNQMMYVLRQNDLNYDIPADK